MKFKAKVIPSGNATGVETPKKIVEALRSGPRPLITVTINGHTWRSRIARTRGLCLVGISAANRVASGIAEGDIVVVDLTHDTAPRVVAPPPDLARALRDDAEANSGFRPPALWPQAQTRRRRRRSENPGDSTAEDRQAGRVHV